MTRRYYIFILVLLFAIIALSERYLPTFEALSLKAKPQTTASDFFLENTTSTVMTHSGKPDYIVNAKRMTHFPDRDIVELKKVNFQLKRNQHANWSADAELGIIEKRDNIIHLEGNVILQRPGAENIEAIKLTTPELHIYSKQDYAETEAPVKIDSGNNQITAVGMRLYLKEGRIEFLSTTRGTYYAPRS
ncbi:MAG: LPS export ABC transporter periplasmic protein LptC [Thioalkalispiraceae bacterium]|jgi:lipopolysaccharide export system protein LptC